MDLSKNINVLITTLIELFRKKVIIRVFNLFGMMKMVKYKLEVFKIIEIQKNTLKVNKLQITNAYVVIK